MTPTTEALVVLALTAAADVLLGEPPVPLHPVVWIGSAQRALAARAPRRPAGPAFLAGLALAVVGPAAVFALAWVAVHALSAQPVTRVVVEVYLLKGSSSLRMLGGCALAVERALGDGLDAAREALRSLVSRDTSRLPAPLLRAAAVESVAENASDSWVAPLVFFAVGGVPAALAYRAANTLDSLVGYRGELEWLGKAGARLDDALNFVPARLAALLVAMAAFAARPFVASDGVEALRVAWRDGGATASPNAGWPMAAMAGALGLELEKVDHYVLGRGGRAPVEGDIRRAVVLLGLVGGLALVVAGALAAARIALVAAVAR